MPITIRHWENNSSETWIIVNDDATVTYEIENSGWAARDGVNSRRQKMTAGEAKEKFPSLTESIDIALSEISGKAS